MTLQSGETVALVGNSGNGKSTCLQILQRFYDPDQGEVLIDGFDIKHLNLNSLRSKIAAVGQEPVLFSTSIGENIRYGNPDATDREIIQSAQDAGAHDFIIRLPMGYNTLVGDKGSQLSGGQKQRIAIARALIQNPKILLLDEATSALDYQAEKFVQKTLDRASEGRTTIVVSHRLSAIRSANRIVFIDKGKVIEDGTHSELIALKGRYHDMMKTHFGNECEIDETVDHCEEKRSSETYRLSDSFSLENRSNYSEINQTEINYWKNFKRIVKLVRPNWLILFFAMIASIVIGTSLPLFSIFFAEVYGVSFAIVKRKDFH